MIICFRANHASALSSVSVARVHCIHHHHPPFTSTLIRQYLQLVYTCTLRRFVRPTITGLSACLPLCSCWGFARLLPRRLPAGFWCLPTYPHALHACLPAFCCRFTVQLLRPRIDQSHRRYAAGITNLPTIENLPWINPVPEIKTDVEYTVESTTVCNSTVAGFERFKRADADNSGGLDEVELDRMLYELGRRHTVSSHSIFACD